MSDPVQKLKQFQPGKQFFVGIDSDGCVFDSMEIKHKECFCPQFVNHFGLQPVSKFAREAWDFVNLYSKTRGCNRFLALLRALELVAEREEVKARNVAPSQLKELRDWVSRESKLSNASLANEVERNPSEELKLVQAWSEDVNQTVEKIVRNVPPFPLVKECLEKIVSQSDAVVCSQTPTEALVREWAEHGISKYVREICGQELGTKTQHLDFVAGGKYPEANMLMIGDAPGDLKAAQANNCLFFPINPGDEEASWQQLLEEGIEKFFSGTYAGAYEEGLIKTFESYLPEDPPWKK